VLSREEKTSPSEERGRSHRDKQHHGLASAGYRHHRTCTIDIRELRISNGIAETWPGLFSAIRVLKFPLSRSIHRPNMWGRTPLQPASLELVFDDYC
jgi:hypothetical protein